MKAKILCAVLLLCFCTTISAQEKNKPAPDTAVAKKPVSKASVMKMYTMVILTTGKADIKEKPVKDSLFAGHMKNIQRLAAEGKLLVAGPFGKNDINYRGIFIFDTESVDEAKGMVASDPAVNAGIFDAIYLPWYASAALMEVNKIHEKLEKESL